MIEKFGGNVVTGIIGAAPCMGDRLEIGVRTVQAVYHFADI